MVGRRLHGSTPHGDIGWKIFLIRIAVHLLFEAGTGDGESPPASGDAPCTLVVDAPLTKAPLFLRAKVPLVMLLQAKVQRA